MLIVFGFDDYYPSGGTNDIVAIVEELIDPTMLPSPYSYPFDRYHALEFLGGKVHISYWNNETKEWEGKSDEIVGI